MAAGVERHTGNTAASGRGETQPHFRSFTHTHSSSSRLVGRLLVSCLWLNWIRWPPEHSVRRRVNVETAAWSSGLASFRHNTLRGVSGSTMAVWFIWCFSSAHASSRLHICETDTWISWRLQNELGNRTLGECLVRFLQAPTIDWCRVERHDNGRCCYAVIGPKLSIFVWIFKSLLDVFHSFILWHWSVKVKDVTKCGRLSVNIGHLHVIHSELISSFFFNFFHLVGFQCFTRWNFGENRKRNMAAIVFLNLTRFTFQTKLTCGLTLSFICLKSSDNSRQFTRPADCSAIRVTRFFIGNVSIEQVKVTWSRSKFNSVNLQVKALTNLSLKLTQVNRWIVELTQLSLS